MRLPSGADRRPGRALLAGTRSGQLTESKLGWRATLASGGLPAGVAGPGSRIKSIEDSFSILNL